MGTNNVMELVAPTGNVIIGHVLDCNKASLERELKAYDKQLYIKWNPKKRNGWGCWEVRRTPDTCTNVFQGYLEDNTPLLTLEYKEIDIINHVLDLPYLSRNTLGKLKQMDMWNNKNNWVNDLEYREELHREKQSKAAREDLRYNIQQNKQEWRDFAKFVSEGGNPGQVLTKAFGKK